MSQSRAAATQRIEAIEAHARSMPEQNGRPPRWRELIERSLALRDRIGSLGLFDEPDAWMGEADERSEHRG